jgi:hypothetical protein
MSTTGYGIFSIVIKLDALSTMTIDNKDIWRAYWKEDIYLQGTLGKLVLFDKYGLKEYGPLTGDEKIVLAYGSDGVNAKEFSLIKIDKISSITEFEHGKSSVIELCFTDTYYRNLTMKKYSKAWSKKTASDIIKDIVENMLEVTSSYEIESSDTEFESFYMPWWTPAETIRYISARAKGTKGKCNYGYLFYSNSQKLINFTTLDALLNNSTIDSDTYVFQTSDINYVNKVQAYEMSGVDHQGIKEIGGGRLLGFDGAKKEFLGIESDDSFIYSTAVKKISTLGSSSLFDGNYVDNDSSKFNYTYSLEGEDSKDMLKNIFYNNFIRRYSLHNCSKIVVLGHQKRYAGMKINVQWPSMNANEIYSSMDSGQYLIKSIMHNFTPMTTPQYSQTLTILKNAYLENKFNNTTSVSGTINNLVSSIMKLGSF